MERLLVIIFFIGIGLGVLAPLLRRYVKASYALAAGAAAVVAFAIFGLAHTDPRIGLQAIEANRREYLFTLVFELPVLLLALISAKYSQSTFWLGWAINLAFASYVTVIIVWLEFFWHW